MKAKAELADFVKYPENEPGVAVSINIEDGESSTHYGLISITKDTCDINTEMVQILRTKYIKSSEKILQVEGEPS